MHIASIVESSSSQLLVVVYVRTHVHTTLLASYAIYSLRRDGRRYVRSVPHTYVRGRYDTIRYVYYYAYVCTYLLRARCVLR